MSRTAVVAVPTFRRVELLRPLLVELLRQVADVGDWDVSVLVVDNDTDCSAHPAAHEAGVDYLSVPEPGIAHARQAALDAAGAADVVIMIDDDVEPSDRWLVALLEGWVSCRSPVVVGHVDYVWPEDADPWFEAGGFMRRSRRPDGTDMTSLATGNALFDVAALRRLGVGFDGGLGLAGGEDSQFGEDLLAAGGRITAWSSSVVRDVVPPERLTRAFVRRRTVAHGVARSRLELRHATGVRLRLEQLRSIVTAVVRVTLFGGMHLVGRLTGRLRLDAVGRRRYWFALGRLLGAMGHSSQEYART